MNSKKLFISDLDGTLLSDCSTLSNYTREKLIQILTDDKVGFTVASARSLTTIKEVLGDIPFRLPVIQLNGACVTDFRSHKDLVSIPIEKSYVSALFEILKQRSLCFLVTAMKDEQPTCFIPKKRNQLLERFYLERIEKQDRRIQEVESMDESSQYTILSITIISRNEEVYNLSKVIDQALNRKVKVYPMGMDFNGWEWITVQSHLASKGNAIRLICLRYGFPMSQATSFGDNINDLSMIRETGMGIAVENAIEELKENAQKVIGHCNHDSVIDYVWQQSYGNANF